MKLFKTIAKIASVLIAIAGAAYVIVTYSDQIIALAKKVVDFVEGICDSFCKKEIKVVDEPAAEETAEEAPEGAETAEETETADEAEDTPVAEEADFEN